MGVHVDAGRFALLREMLPALEAVAELPEVSLEDAEDDHVMCVAGLFGILDEPRYAGRGVRGTIVSKVLHRKRPDLVPIYDSRIFEAYTAQGVLPRTPGAVVAGVHARAVQPDARRPAGRARRPSTSCRPSPRRPVRR